MNQIQTTALLFFLALSQSVHAEADLILPFTASYDIHINHIKVAELNRELTASNDGTMEYKSLAKTVGIAALLKKDTTQEHSQFKIADTRVKPISYVYQRERKKKSKHVSITYDHTGNKIITSVNKQERQFDGVDETYDKLTSQIIMMLQRLSGERIADQKITDGKKISNYSFKKLADEALPIKEFSLSTEKWERNKASSNDKTLFWLAPQLGYLPVKVEVLEEGEDVISIVLNTSSLLQDE